MNNLLEIYDSVKDMSDSEIYILKIFTQGMKINKENTYKKLPNIDKYSTEHIAKA